jgi:hypothetical protein
MTMSVKLKELALPSIHRSIDPWKSLRAKGWGKPDWTGDKADRMIFNRSIDRSMEL